MTRRHGLFRHAFLLLVLSLGLGLAGCEGDDGADGMDGADGADGATGAAGQACWDLNNNGVGDLPDEDINNDEVVDVYDCNAYADGAYEIDQLHAGYFTEHPYEGTQSCLNCHGLLAEEVLQTAHFEWAGPADNIVGELIQGQIHGKKDILNNFCIGVPSNEGRCTQCHAGYGWADNTFDFQDPKNIDCLVCHDQTATYQKAKPSAGLPEGDVDLQAVARSVAMNGGKPTIENCIDCHAFAGGGDNVKHGDIALALANTTTEYDVHMGQDADLPLVCVDCHQVEKDINGKLLSHGIGGMPYHSVDEGFMKTCEDCHGTAENRHAAYPVAITVNSHPTLACQVCHIPAIARQRSTKTEWYWDTAGEIRDPIPPDANDPTRPSFDRKKGDFVWEFNVRPTLRRFNGTWEKTIIGINDTYADGEGTPENPIVLGAPIGSRGDGMIYPFKKMIGNQPADVGFQRILTPHLFGTAGGPTPFWGNWDWVAALAEGAAASGQEFSGEVGFVHTEMYLSVNHEVAPREMAFGYDNGGCTDCHFSDQIEWTEIGWTGDPADGGEPIP